MARTVQCARLGVEAEGLDRPPFPGPLGERIYENISKQAWEEWLKFQTLLINEHHLVPFEPQAKQFLEAERERFLYSGENSAKPEGYVPPKTEGQS